MIQLFFEALAKFLRNKGGKDQEVLRRELDELYKTYLKQSRLDFNKMSVEEIVNSFNDDEKVFKTEIVAELIYQDALVENEDNELLIKALGLFKYVDLISETFSVDRHRKIGEIEDLLKQYTPNT
ncbi:hypothetical protein D0T85_10170 [Bacteroides sp. 519]|nr:hypothetical protein [Bacteroides sp. 519]